MIYIFCIEKLSIFFHCDKRLNEPLISLFNTIRNNFYGDLFRDQNRANLKIEEHYVVGHRIHFSLRMIILKISIILNFYP